MSTGTATVSKPIAAKRRPIHRFFVTFGQRSPFRNGYVEVIVDRQDITQGEALQKASLAAHEALGTHWSNIYSHDEFLSRSCVDGKCTQDLFPAGKVGETIYG